MSHLGSPGGPFFGIDFGLREPTAAIQCWRSDNLLLIEREAYAIGCDTDRIPALLDEFMPDARRHVMRGDCSRPETISWLKRNGFPNITACEKWKGSVEDGVAFLRACERIVIHPRCTHFLQECRLYSYKTDRLTGEVLAGQIKDGNDHLIDALRYALEPLIKNPGQAAFGSLPRFN